MTRQKLSSRTIILTATTALAAGGLFFAVPPAQGVTISDDFNRADSNDLGTLSDGVHTWAEAEPAGGNVRIDGNRALLQYNGSDAGVGGGVQDEQILNGQVEAEVLKSLRGASTNYKAGVSYRAASATDAGDFLSGVGYFATVFGEFNTSRDIALFVNDGSGLSEVARANIGGRNGTLSYPYTIRAEFDGSRHQIFFDDGDGDHVESTNPVIDVLDTSITDAGFVGVGTQYDRVFVDDFSASGVIPEPSTMALLGLGGLAMLGWRRRA